MPKFSLEDYVDVQTRIVRFWEEYPDGRIITCLVSLPDDYDRVVFKAEVFKHRDNPVPDVSGYDGEVAGTGGANNIAHHANAETSAIGRALANMGYATSQKDRPSRQEMEKVERFEGAPLPARSRSTSVNTVPNEQPTATGWTQFWNAARKEGLSTKPEAEKAIGQLGADPDYALERLAAWAHDNLNATQRELAS